MTINTIKADTLTKVIVAIDYTQETATVTSANLSTKFYISTDGKK